MRIFILIFIVLALLLSAVYFIKPSVFNAIEQQVSKLKPVKAASTSTKIYKWTDKYGVVQISNSPPPAGIISQQVEYPHDVNIIPSIPVNKKDKK